MSGARHRQLRQPRERLDGGDVRRAGDYRLRLTASDGALTASDDVEIVANPGNEPPRVSAGADGAMTTAVLALAGQVSDDGLPAGSPLDLAVDPSQRPGTGDLCERSFAHHHRSVRGRRRLHAAAHGDGRRCSPPATT